MRFKVGYIWVRFEVLTAVSMKIAVLWVVAPCSLVEGYNLIKLSSKFNNALKKVA
jgi:hypothetical protein